jgi:methyltransferase
MFDTIAPVPTTLFVALVVATIGQRLFELVRSRTNQGTMRTHGFNRVDSSLSYVCMVVVHSTWFVAMLLEHTIFPRTLLGAMSWLALVVFVAAQMLRLWALRSLGSQWNVQVMAPDLHNDQLGLVTVGPYRYVRHPNYLAVILEFLSLPIVGGAPITALVWSLLNGVVLFFRIQYEESHLARRPGYEQHLSTIPCLIPRLWIR